MSPSSATNDSELWNAFRAGDRNALDLVYQQQVRALYNYGFKLTQNRDLVEDCIQDIFVELWEKRERLGTTDSIRYYLFKVLRRTLLRRQAQNNRQSTGTAFLENVLSEDSFEVRLIVEQSSARTSSILQKALDRLSGRQREVILLRFYNELTFEEIAHTMDIDVKSVYKLTYKALGSLKKKMTSSNVLIGSSIILILLYFL
ncbi:RNA polymerase sigma factor [Persicitalea jodogahamensis]|uniref:DNA-directed RNA polymerase sigma-70 factor n=1 Tax=Persicitalea jodogahamensis TaxID=402147 RepID=A0A8J3GAC0_9BACT|nr:RNA polymerase sigma factor [Persicitalea jodogahamensis]GHB73077.1 DNA-directed RNA polymerase sigma-70 factor [Persicitalea jodogahamensis]